jgi:hypothetical protein
MSDTLDLLEKQYFTIKSNFNQLIASCETDVQRTAMQNAYATARDNYNTALNRVLNDNDPTVTGLRTELQTKQQQIESSLANLQNIVTTIDTITAGVAVGTKLVGSLGGA